MDGRETEGAVATVMLGEAVMAPDTLEAVTGHTVVEMAMVLVTTVVDRAGQFVTVGAQDVMVISVVVKTVDVERDTVGVIGAVSELFDGAVAATSELFDVAVAPAKEDELRLDRGAEWV